MTPTAVQATAIPPPAGRQHPLANQPTSVAATRTAALASYAQSGLPRCRAVATMDDDFIGLVSWYWESRETDWRRLGIVLHDPRHWSRGFGSHALALWVDWLFTSPTYGGWTSRPGRATSAWSG